MLQSRHQLPPCSTGRRLQHHPTRCQHSGAICARAARPACRAAPRPVAACSRPLTAVVGSTSAACGAAAGAAPSHTAATCSMSRAAGVVCRDAPRPMWAAKQPVEAPKQTGSALERMITKNISRCSSVVELSDVYNDWGSSFNFIHAAAALVKSSKLPGGSRSRLVDKLCSTWLSQLPLSGTQGCTNVLWACVRLGPGAVQRLWGPTWEAYIALLRQEAFREGACPPQQLATPLWACAKLRKQPSWDELQLLVQSFLQPAVLTEANSQELANIIWALGELYRQRDWKGGVSDQDMQQLLGKQQLQVLAAGGTGQDVSNVLLSTARIAAGEAPLLSVADARCCSQQLLALTYQQIASWEPQHITNALWACSQLGLTDAPFVTAAVAAAPMWVPRSVHYNLTQALTASATLGLRDEAFARQLLQHGLRLLEPGGNGKGHMRHALKAADRDSLAALSAIAVVRQDMRSLAGIAVELVSRSGVGQRPITHLSNLSRLWTLHSWLLQHQLLDRKGLAGVVTEQQLQQGAKEAAAYGYERLLRLD